MDQELTDRWSLGEADSSGRNVTPERSGKAK